MDAVLRFPKDEVLKLVAHALASPSQQPTYSQVVDALDLAEGFPDSDDFEKASHLIAPSLHLVKDRGVYLMSAGLPHLPDPNRPDNPQWSLAIYAEGLSPSDEGWHEVANDILGGDDFSQALPARDVDRLASQSPDEDIFRINVQDDTFTIECVASDGPGLTP